MNNIRPTNQQKGVVLIIALIMLLAITLITVTSMRNTTLESNITTSHRLIADLQDSAESALREGEFRFYGPGHIRDKTEPVADNCSLENLLVASGLNKPCLLDISTTSRDQFVKDPSSLTDSMLNTIPALDWMPFRGLSAEIANELTGSQHPGNYPAWWNSMLITTSEEENESLNPEYGSVLEGKGTYFYLINSYAQDAAATGETLYLQSTIANIYTGINN